MRKQIPGLVLAAVVVGFLSSFGFGQTNSSTPANSSTTRSAVVVLVQSPDFTVQRLKYRVFYNKGETRKIPFVDYDFKAAFTDELMNALASDTRMQFFELKTETQVDVIGVMKKKVPPPQTDAERILLVNVIDFGAFIADLGPDKFYMWAGFKLIDRASGKKLWEKRFNERQDLDQKLEELQADNQKGMKVGINKVLERVCKQVVDEMMKKPIP